jgi:hypothetical protein
MLLDGVVFKVVKVGLVRIKRITTVNVKANRIFRMVLLLSAFLVCFSLDLLFSKTVLGRLV